MYDDDRFVLHANIIESNSFDDDLAWDDSDEEYLEEDDDFEDDEEYN